MKKNFIPLATTQKTHVMKNLLTLIFIFALAAGVVSTATAQTGKPLKGFSVKAGVESKTDGFYMDATGKAFPIYIKRLTVSALPNATTGNVAHGVTSIKLDGPIQVEELVCSSGTAGATARTNRQSLGVTFGFTSTNLVIASTADLSAQAGTVLISYCKTTD